jgi:hypothetical protein
MGNLLPNVVDRVGKLANSIQEKCNFKLKFINDQRELPFLEGSTKKRYLPSLGPKDPYDSPIKRLKLIGIMKKPSSKRKSFIGRRKGNRTTSHDK